MSNSSIEVEKKSDISHHLPLLPITVAKRVIGVYYQINFYLRECGKLVKFLEGELL